MKEHSGRAAVVKSLGLRAQGLGLRPGLVFRVEVQHKVKSFERVQLCDVRKGYTTLRM